MALMTRQKIITLYEKYKAVDVIFTKEIVEVTGLVTKQIFLKCGEDIWPCAIYSSSFQEAKVVANLDKGILKKIERANNMVSIRFCFRKADSANPVPFFMAAKFMSSVSNSGSQDTALITLQFTQRPPDDLIEIVGRVLDANINFKKRRGQYIPMTPDSLRRMNIPSKECVIYIQDVPRNCILRELSFSGAKVIMVGIEKFLINKDVALRIDFEDPRETIVLKGKFINAEGVQGRKELVALALNLDESDIPMGYKIRINEFISQVRADIRGSEDVVVEKNTNGSLSEETKKPEPAREAKGSPPAETKDSESEKPRTPEKPLDLEDFDLILPGSSG